MSSSERFVRQHKRQSDRAISQAYARLATNPLGPATFVELFDCVRQRAPRLLDGPIINGRHPGVEALVNLSRFTSAHVRAAADWPGRPYPGDRLCLLSHSIWSASTPCRRFSRRGTAHDPCAEQVEKTCRRPHFMHSIVFVVAFIVRARDSPGSGCPKIRRIL